MDLADKKINRVVQLLSNMERKQFLKFLSSPYFVKTEHQTPLHKLYGLLTKKSKSGLDSEALLFEFLYPGEEFIAGRIDKLFSQFIKLLHRFLGIQEIEKSEQVAIAAARVLRERKELDLWKGHFSKIRKKVLRQKYNVKEQGFELLKLDLEQFNYDNLSPRSTSRESFLQIMDAFDRFYISNALDISIQILAYNKFSFPIEIESRFEGLKFLLAQQTAYNLSENDNVFKKIFYLLIDNSNISKKDIEELLLYLDQQKSELDNEVFIHARAIARNLANHLYNEGQKDLEPFILSLYQKEIQNGYIFHNGKIQSGIVNNISTFAIRQKQFEWLDSFLTNYKTAILETELQSFIIALNRSKMHFFNGRYDEVLSHLEFDVTNINLKTIARTLEIMTYYELNSDQLSYKIEAFKIFIFRIPDTKASFLFITGHKNFIDILRSIHHPRTKFDLKRIEKLRQRISETEILAEKAWLLEKIDQLVVNL